MDHAGYFYLVIFKLWRGNGHILCLASALHVFFCDMQNVLCTIITDAWLQFFCIVQVQLRHCYRKDLKGN